MGNSLQTYQKLQLISIIGGIGDLGGENIVKNMGLFEQAIKNSIDFLYTELKICSKSILPHAHQLIALCYFFSKVKNPNSKQIKAIKKWFWKTSFSKRYSGATDKAVNEDIQNLKRLNEKKDYNVFDKLKYSVTEEQIRNTKFGKMNAFTRAFIALLANQEPLNLTNGAKIDIGKALSEFNKREYHHIFPDAFLQNKNYSAEKINSICNYCLLPSISNKKISCQAPSEYFKELVPKDNYKKILESNLLPIKNTIYEEDDYDLFLMERSKKIIECIDEQLV